MSLANSFVYESYDDGSSTRLSGCNLQTDLYLGQQRAALYAILTMFYPGPHACS